MISQEALDLFERILGRYFRVLSVNGRLTLLCPDNRDIQHCVRELGEDLRCSLCGGQGAEREIENRDLSQQGGLA